MRHQNMNLEIKAVESDGSFSGYGSVFDNIDSYGEIVRAGAFEQSLQSWRAKGRLPPMLWNHNRDEPIGVYTKMAEDARGLYVEGRIEGKVLAEDGSKAMLTLAEQGHIEGEVRAAVVVLSGRLDGDVHAGERVELTPTARVNGNVHYQVVEMSAGAQLNGRLLHSAAMAALPAPQGEAGQA